MWVFQASSPYGHLCPTPKHAPGHPQSSRALNKLLLKEKRKNLCMYTAVHYIVAMLLHLGTANPMNWFYELF